MRAIAALVACVAAAIVASGTAGAGTVRASLAGHWEGALVQRGQRLPIRLDFARDGEAPAGRFSVDRWRVMDYPLNGVTVHGERVTFGVGDTRLTGQLS